MVSGAEIRGFGFLDSWYQVPKFVVSGTERQKSTKPGRGLLGFWEAVTLLNTDSNLNNTKGASKKTNRTVGNTGRRKRDDDADSMLPFHLRVRAGRSQSASVKS